MYHPRVEPLAIALREWSKHRQNWEAVRETFIALESSHNRASTFLASATELPEVISALAEHAILAQPLLSVQQDIALADASRKFLTGLMLKLRGQNAPNIGAVQTESERSLLNKRLKWHSEFGRLIETVTDRSIAQRNGAYPAEAPLASYEELQSWLGLWREFHRSAPADGPLFRRASWEEAWRRFKNLWVPLERFFYDEAPEDTENTATFPELSSNAFPSSADHASENAAFFGDTGGEIEESVSQALAPFRADIRTDAVSSRVDKDESNVDIELRHSRISSISIITEPSSPAPHTLEEFLAGLHQTYEVARNEDVPSLSYAEEHAPRALERAKLKQSVTLSLEDVPSVSLLCDEHLGLVAHTPRGYFAIRGGNSTPLRSDLIVAALSGSQFSADPTTTSIEDSCGIQRLVLDHCVGSFFPQTDQESSAHGTVVLHIDGLAGSDDFFGIRIQLMAEVVTRFDPSTAVLLQGSDHLIERFQIEYDRIGGGEWAKAPLFTDSVGVPNIHNAIHLVSNRDAEDQNTLANSHTLRFEDLPEDQAAMHLFAPRFFVAQSESRHRR